MRTSQSDRLLSEVESSLPPSWSRLPSPSPPLPPITPGRWGSSAF